MSNTELLQSIIALVREAEEAYAEVRLDDLQSHLDEIRSAAELLLSRV